MSLLRFFFSSFFSPQDYFLFLSFIWTVIMRSNYTHFLLGDLYASEFWFLCRYNFYKKWVIVESTEDFVSFGLSKWHKLTQKKPPSLMLAFWLFFLLYDGVLHNCPYTLKIWSMTRKWRANCRAKWKYFVLKSSDPHVYLQSNTNKEHCGVLWDIQARHFFVKKVCTGVIGIGEFHHINCQNFSALSPYSYFFNFSSQMSNLGSLQSVT